MFKRFIFSGTKQDNVITGTNRMDVLFGRKGNDVLDGRGGNDFLFGGKGDDQLFGGEGNDKLFGGKGNDFLDGGAGRDYLFGDKGDDTFNFTMSENLGAKDYYDGGKGFDTLQLTLTQAQYDAAKPEIDQFKAHIAEGGKDFHFESFGLVARNFEDVKVELIDGGGNTAPVAMEDSFTFDEDTPTVLDVLGNDSDADNDALSAEIVQGPANGSLELNADGTITYTPALDFNGSDAFTYQAFDGTASSAPVVVNLTVNPVNDMPVAMDDEVTALAQVVTPQKIQVAVVGVANASTHGAAALQLNADIFNAVAIDYTDRDAVSWTQSFQGFDVVVLGASESNDYGATTGIFAALNDFVSMGGGVVTTGWFAQALSIMTPSIQGLADAITPITPDGRSYSSNVFGTTPNDTITVAPGQIPNDITGAIGTFQSGGRFGWELALDVDSGAVRLADGVAGDRDNPGDFGNPHAAIAYATNVGQDGTAGLPGGNTVYLGGMYLASTAYVTEATRGVDQDALFEQAIAWAAGGRSGPTASAKIDAALLLLNDTDVDASDVLAIDRDAFPMASANGAALAFDENGDILYTPTADGLQLLLNGQPIADSFDYTVTDGNGGWDVASVSLTVDTLL
jgi:hypothetical protein